MIFVTVGTHEQPFDRLVECVDNLKKDGTIEYSGRFYTPIPEIGNRSSDVKETALPF